MAFFVLLDCVIGAEHHVPGGQQLHDMLWIRQPPLFAWSGEGLRKQQVPHCPHHATSRARLSAARASASRWGGVERGDSDVVILGAAEVSEVRVEPAIRRQVVGGHVAPALQPRPWSAAGSER